MKPMQLTFATLTTLLISLTLWSCNKDKTLSESDEAHSAQEQPSAPSLSSGVPGTGGGMRGTGGGMTGSGSGMRGTGGETMDQLRTGCPMAVQGADVTVADTDKGVALTFATDEGDIVDLRTRVKNMAKMYEMQRGQIGMRWQHMGGEGMGHGGRGMGGQGMGRNRSGPHGEGMGRMAGRDPMPATSDTVTDTDKGAQLELRPTDPSQLDALREHVRRHQERMHSGECLMSQSQPTKTPQE